MKYQISIHPCILFLSASFFSFEVKIMSITCSKKETVSTISVYHLFLLCGDSARIRVSQTDSRALLVYLVILDGVQLCYLNGQRDGVLGCDCLPEGVVYIGHISVPFGDNFSEGF